MAVDAATLDRYIAEIAGDDQELVGLLRDKLGTKEQAAQRFVGGFLRNQDYTQKTQQLANERKQLESLQSDYESRLTAAETEKDKIMKDLAEARITGSKAQALLRTVKDAYALTDTDLPGIEDIRETARTGQVVDSTPDLDNRFQTFETKLMDRITKQLIPEISGLAMLGPVWNDISHEHEKLFGSRLTKQSQSEILKEAREQNRSLEQVWADKYSVPDKRLEVRDNGNREKWKREWDDEQAKKNQDLALRGLNPESNETAMLDRQSPLFKRSFAPKEAQAENNSALPVRSDAERERGSGADRAAARFMERARNGQLGKPLTEKQPA